MRDKKLAGMLLSSERSSSTSQRKFTIQTHSMRNQQMLSTFRRGNGKIIITNRQSSLISRVFSRQRALTPPLYTKRYLFGSTFFRRIKEKIINDVIKKPVREELTNSRKQIEETITKRVESLKNDFHHLGQNFQKLNQTSTKLESSVNQLESSLNQLPDEIKKLGLIKEAQKVGGYHAWFKHTLDYGKKAYRSTANGLKIAAFSIAAFEVVSRLGRSNETSTIDPLYQQQTPVAWKLLGKLLKLSEQDMHIDGSASVPKSGIYCAWLVGSWGMGKSQGVKDAINLYRIHYPQRLAEKLHARDEMSFRYEVIQLAQKLGMSILKGKDINYESAVDYLCDTLPKQPGWLLVVDSVTDDSATDIIVKFLKKIQQQPQSGKIIIAADKPILNVQRDHQALETIGVICAKTLLNLDYQRAFSNHQALRFLETLLQDVYKDEKNLDTLSRAFKQSTVMQFVNPGFPHSDKQLKKELIELLGYSPHAIHTAALWITEEHRRTRQSPEYLISTYCFQLRQHLNLKKDDKPFVSPPYAVVPDQEEQEQLRKKYQQLQQAVHAIALNKLDIIAEQTTGREHRIAKLAQQVLPLCTYFNPHYLDQHYVQHYLHINSEDALAVVDLLCRYGLLGRYHPSKEKAQARDYTEFYVQDALRPAYLAKLVQEEIKVREDFNQKQTTKDQEKIIDAKDIEKEIIDKHLKELLILFIQYEFHLGEAHLKTEGLGWQYAAHCLQILAHYEANCGGQLKVADVPSLLLFINPVLNLSAQAGSIKEMELLYQSLKQLLKSLEQNNNNIPAFPSFPTHIKFGDNGQPEDAGDKQEITKFCEDLAAVDAVYKDKPMLPALYAEFIYYYARRCFKTDVSKEERQQCDYAIQLAYAMRKVIDDRKSIWQDVPRMNHDTVTFKQDGLGLIWLTRETSADLQRAYHLYDADAVYYSQKDNRQTSKCNRYLAEIECRLVRRALEQNQLLPIILNDANNQPITYTIPQLFDSAEKHLKLSFEQIKQEADLKKQLLKDKRYYIGMMRLSYLQAKWHQEQAKANSADTAVSKLNENSYIGYMQQAARYAREAIHLCGYDQRNDISTAFAYLATIYQNLAEISSLRGEKLQYLKAALNAIEQSITLQEDIKTYRYDKELLQAYDQQITIQQELVELNYQQKNYEFAWGLITKALCNITKLISVIQTANQQAHQDANNLLANAFETQKEQLEIQHKQLIRWQNDLRISLALDQVVQQNPEFGILRF